jgi:hypothetical protein
MIKKLAWWQTFHLRLYERLTGKTLLPGKWYQVWRWL